MPENQGIYVSISTQNPSTKILIATSRDTWAECKQDLSDIFGEEFAEQIAKVGSGNTTFSKPQLTVVSDSPMPVEQVAAELGATVGQEQSFETCTCGYLKNRWVPPGISKKTNNAYTGFFACSNPVSHR